MIASETISSKQPTSLSPICCSRCGASIKGGLTSHRRACLRLPRPEVLAGIFLSGVYASTEAMALHYKVSTGFLESRLLLGGVDSVLIDETREWTTHAVQPRPYPKCSICEIYVVPDNEPMPEGWKRAVNQMVVADFFDPRSNKTRHGSLCIACHEGR